MIYDFQQNTIIVTQKIKLLWNPKELIEPHIYLIVALYSGLVYPLNCMSPFSILGVPGVLFHF